MAVSNVPEKLEATLNAIVEADSEPVKIYRGVGLIQRKSAQHCYFDSPDAAMIVSI